RAASPATPPTTTCGFPATFEAMEAALEHADFVGAMHVDVSPDDRIRAWYVVASISASEPVLRSRSLRIGSAQWPGDAQRRIVPPAGQVPPRDRNNNRVHRRAKSSRGCRRRAAHHWAA